MTTHILVVDDDLSMCEMLRTRLEKRDFRVTTASSGREAIGKLTTAEPDLVVTDIHMTDIDGLALCAEIVARQPETPVIVMTAFGTLDTAIAAIRAGAYDFVTKPLKIDELLIAIHRAIERRQLRAEVRRLRQVVDSSQGFGDLIGSSPVMRRLYDLLARAAESDANVLITGESGTGKELVARALHRSGRKRTGPFVALNCAAVPEGLLEAELFGHVRGAFTDAHTHRVGTFVQANRGTLFLDEIGELPLGLQAKLLRALDDRVVNPLGANEPIPFDARLIAATNRDLETAVEEGRFRSDLFFRLHVIRIETPPLRERRGDILTLAQAFLQRFAKESGREVLGISEAAAARLLGYGWPGNVRELRNCIERAVALTRDGEITVEDLPPAIVDGPRSSLVLRADDPAGVLPLEEVERAYVRQVLDLVDGNKSLASRLLQVDRKTLARKLDPLRGNPASAVENDD